MSAPESIRLLVHGPARGARNMALDHALMAAAREGRPTLRFYRWDPPCLSLGRHQEARGQYDRAAAREAGVDIVRRPTGGRAVYHDRELTYAVAAPAGLWGGLRASYRRINRALLRGLGRAGAAAKAAGDARGRRAPGPSTRACFRDPLPGEIVAAGRKLVGSAQWRDRGGLLQHGSILLQDDQRVARTLRADAGEEETAAAAGPDGGGPAGAASLADLLGRAPEPGELVEPLVEGFREELGLAVSPGELSPEETSAARELEKRYGEDDWTWRR